MKILIVFSCLTDSQHLVLTYQMYINTMVRHRRTACFTKFRIPGADSSFLKVPILGFNFRFNLSFPLPSAIYCNTSSASAVFPWEYSQRGDSGSMLIGKNRKAMITGSFLRKKHWSQSSSFANWYLKPKMYQPKIQRTFYLHCSAYYILHTPKINTVNLLEMLDKARSHVRGV